jgi:hypothetical protein
LHQDANAEHASGLLIAFSTEPGKSTLNGGGDHSPIASALAQLIGEGVFGDGDQLLPHRFDGVCLSDPENDREFFQLSHTARGTLQLLDTYITYFTRSITRPANVKSAKALRTITVWCSDLSAGLADLKALVKK